ncbi:hypothetical protein GGR52DRAFT_569737 [Hypoxylon sp. FL1284]|nr:hypothetical protein GGR52DRAFT_569737 [Hypoxylon sp. FL1284]
MQFNFLLPVMLAFSILGAASPIRCPDSKRDLILKGTMPAEECCSYGVCQNTVVVAMGQDQKSLGSGVRYNERR